MKKLSLALFSVGVFLAGLAHAQVASPNYWRTNAASSTITPINPALQVPCANIVGGCGGGGSGSSTVSSPLTVTGVATATIYGSESSTWIANFNQTRVMPTPSMLALGASCGGVYPVFDFGQCHDDIYNALGSSTNILSGPWSYSYTYPIVNARAGVYVADQGVGGGASTWTFTPSYYAVTSANSSTKVISYSSVGGSPVYFNGEAVTAVGASLPGGLTIHTLYYVGNLTSSTLVLYTNSTLTATSSVTGTGTGTLETPAATYDIGQNQSYGWGACGIALAGPNNGSSTGWYFGGSNGARSVTLCNGSVEHFYYNIYTGDNTYFWTIANYYSHLNAPNPSGGLFWNDSTANSDEEMNMTQDVFADAEPAASSTAVSQAVHIQTSGFDDYECNGTSFDDAGVYFDVYDGQNNSFHSVNCRWENPGAAGGGWTAYVPFSTNPANPNTSVDVGITNAQFLNDGSGGNAFTNMMQIGSNVKVTLTDVSAAANVFIGASTVTDFMTLGTNSTVTSNGFANQSDGPGVTYLYNTRTPVAGLMTNAPTFLDSTLQVTGNFTYFNGYIGNPIVSTVSSTLSAFSPNYQICNGTSTVNYTLPTIANNTGLDFDLANRGSANCTVTATSTNFLYSNGATSTVLTLAVGQTARIINDATYWTTLANADFNTSNVSTSTANTWSAAQTFTAPVEASGTQYFSLFASSTASTANSTVNWNISNVQELKLTTSTTVAFTNTNPGARYILMLLQDGTGSRTVNWPSTVQWAGGTAPTLTTTASKLDIITFVCAGVSSTDCYGGANLNYSP